MPSFGITPEQGRVLNYLFTAGKTVNLTRSAKACTTKGNCSINSAGGWKKRTPCPKMTGRPFYRRGAHGKRTNLIERMARQMESHPEQDVISPEDWNRF